MQISRRTFLKGSAVTTAGIAAMGFSSKLRILKSIIPEANAAPAGGTYVNSTCRQCPARCGIRVRVVNGKAVKIEGNPNNRINYIHEGPSAGIGGLCPKGAVGIQLGLYDPDRVKGPMKRTNPTKGIDVDPKFVSVSWDEALNDIAGRLKKLREEGKAKTVLFAYGRGMGPIDAGNIKDFTTLLGSPNVIGHGTICAEGSKLAKHYTDGIKTYSIYDWENTNYLLIFGANILEAFRPLTGMLAEYGNMRQGRGQRVKIVYFDTRPTVTGSKADESYLVKPASDGAIALGMAHTILSEGLWNKKFVGDFVDEKNRFATGVTIDAKDFKEVWTFGLIDWWNAILKDFTPQKAAEISDVPAETISRLAREFALGQPGIALFERGPTCYVTGTYNGMCIHALNGLVGSVYVKGGISGIQEGPPLGSLPAKLEEYLDKIALETFEVKKEIDPKTGKEKVNIELKKEVKKFPKLQDVADAQAKGDPYKASMLFTWMTNPFFSSANPQRFWDAFKDVFIVSSSSWMDQTTIFADYILPDPSYLESSWIAPAYPGLGHPHVSIFNPVVPPLYDTKNWFSTLSELAKRIGGKMGEYYAKLGTIEDMRKALLTGEKIDWSYSDIVAKAVWWKKGPRIPYLCVDGKFYKEGKEVTPEEIKEKVFQTPSGKFEFKSGNKEKKIKEKVEKELAKAGITDAKVIEVKQQEEVAKKENDLYPHYKEPKWAGGGDLFLVTPKMVQHAEGRGANTPFLQEPFDLLNNRHSGTYCWMNSRTAYTRGIKDGDNVWVESDVGKIKAIALINPGCRPDTVVVPFEHGHRRAGAAGYGKYATIGSNPNEVTVHLSDPDSNLQSYFQTKVKVSKA